MASPTHVGSTSGSIAGGVTENETLPGSLAENDQVLVGLASDAAIWTVNTSDYSRDIWVDSSAPTNSVYRKIMESTPDSVVNISTVGGASGVVMTAIRGADSTDPWDDNTQVHATGSSGLPNPDSYTTAGDERLRIVYGFLDDDDVALGAGGPSGWDFRAAGDTGNASTVVGATVFVSTLDAPIAGALNPGAFTASSGTDAWRAVHWALKSAAAGGGLTIPIAAYHYFHHLGSMSS